MGKLKLSCQTKIPAFLRGCHERVCGSMWEFWVMTENHVSNKGVDALLPIEWNEIFATSSRSEVYP